MTKLSKLTLPLLACLILASDASAALSTETAKRYNDNAKRNVAAAEQLMRTVTSNIDKYTALKNAATSEFLKTSYTKTLNMWQSILPTIQNNLISQKAFLEKTVVWLKEAEAAVKPVTTTTNTTNTSPSTSTDSSSSTTTPTVDPRLVPETITVKPTIPSTTGLEYGNSRYYSRIGISAAWEQGYTGKGVTVAVLDSGVSNVNTDTKHMYNTTDVIDFTNVFNTTTNSYSRTVITAGQISDINLNTYSNTVKFTTEPIVEIVGSGTGAKAKAILKADGTIASLLLTDAGSGYGNDTTVVIKNPTTGETTTVKASVLLAGKDYIGHGTATSGLIGAKFDNVGTVGIAFDSRVISVKVGDSVMNSNDMIDGARIAVNRGATIINQSIQSSSAYSTNIVNAYKEMLGAGTTFVTAAGNSGLDCLTVSNCNQLAVIPSLTGNSDMLDKPGAWIVVGALDSTGETLASYSNKAGIMKNYYITTYGSSVGVAGLNGGVTTMSGTSFAAPIVSGTMALLQQKWPRLSGAQQAQILFQTADDLGAAGVDDVYGYGRLNVTKAFSPVGDLVIPNAVKNVKGLDSKTTLPVYTTSVGGASLVNAKLAGLTLIDRTIGVDAFERDYQIAMSNNVHITKPIFGFNQFLKIPVSPKMVVGINNIYEAPLVGYRTSKNSTVMYSYVDGILGSSGEGALAFGGKTHYVGYNYNSLDSKNTGIEFDMSYGYADSKRNPDSLIQMSDVQSVGITAKAFYNGFGIMGSIPGKVISGKVSATVPVGINNDEEGTFKYATETTKMSDGPYEKVAGLVYRIGNLDFEATRTFDAFSIEGLIADNLRVTGNWYF